MKEKLGSNAMPKISELLNYHSITGKDEIELSSLEIQKSINGDWKTALSTQQLQAIDFLTYLVFVC